MESGYQKVVIGAPFGIGKTSLAKKIAVDCVLKYLYGEETWIPIFVPLRNNLENLYLDWNLKKVVHELIRSPQSDKKILLILDGLDEYNGDIKNLLKNVNDIFEHIEYKTLITTRLESGVPDKLSINKFVRLFPFTKKQVDEFFSDSKYNLRRDKTELLSSQPIQKYVTITYGDMEKFGMRQEEILTPLFCWMFAIVYKNPPVKFEHSNSQITRTLLYISFIQSIILGKYKHMLRSEEAIIITDDNQIPERYSKYEKYEKWLLRRIAALKMVYKDKLYVETIKQDLKEFAISHQNENNSLLLSQDDINQINNSLENDFLNPILTAYFITSETGKSTVNLMHKSFQEYFLAEFYLEAILSKSLWLGLEVPNEETLQFLHGIINIISDDLLFQNNRQILTVFTNSLGKRNTDELKNEIIDNSRKIFEDKNGSLTTKLPSNSSSNAVLMKMSHKWVSLYVLTCFNSNNNIVDKNEIQKLLVFTSNLIPHRLKFLSKINLTNYEFENLKADENTDLTKVRGPIFDNINLYKADLSEANLAGVLFRSSDLSFADLIKANLSGADLSGANLTRANLSGAELYRANLTGAKLSGADLSRADLSGADLSRADLSGADLSRADLSGADLTGAKLSGAKLYGANLSGAKLSRPNLSGANLTRAKLSRPNLSGADLTRADLSGADLSGAYSYEANLSGANLTGADLTRANLYRTIIAGANLNRAKLVKSLIINPSVSVNDVDISDQQQDPDQGFHLHPPSSMRLNCIEADFSECIIDNENFASYLKKRGGLNVPESVKSKEMLEAKIAEWYRNYGP